jgi:peptide chain release factor 1
MPGSPARGVFDAAIVSDRPGVVVLQVSGPGADQVFANEAGGHRWQRVPPNEKRGRVQTSTVTVAVLREPTPTEVQVRDSDIEWQACRGSGAGGQNRNKVSSAVQIWHRASGIMVRCEAERSQSQNRQTAMALLRARLLEARESAALGTEAATRKAQLGCGARGDKRRTVREQEGQVIDHVTGKRWRLRDYLRGEW